MAAGTTKVLMIGLKSSAVDFEKWPQLSVEKLEAAFVQVLGEVREAGYDAAWCLVGTGASAADDVTAALERHAPDIVLVGAGVRTDPDHLHLFETILNISRERAPRAKFAFNSMPYDTLEALRRWS
ncbi:MAG: hypothetical protein AAFP17_19135 [Pseudomonadota bacterium]